MCVTEISSHNANNPSFSGERVEGCWSPKPTVVIVMKQK